MLMLWQQREKNAPFIAQKKTEKWNMTRKTCNKFHSLSKLWKRIRRKRKFLLVFLCILFTVLSLPSHLFKSFAKLSIFRFVCIVTNTYLQFFFLFFHISTYFLFSIFLLLDNSCRQCVAGNMMRNKKKVFNKRKRKKVVRQRMVKFLDKRSACNAHIVANLKKRRRRKIKS